MMMRPLSIPSAILIGSVLISVSIYVGLVKRNADVVSAQSAGKPAQVPPSPIPSKEILRQHVNKALDALRPQLIESCPAKREKTPDNFVLEYTFSADGQQIARGISEPQTNQNLGLGGCLSGALPNVSIPPPGMTVNVEVPFYFP